ERVRKLAGLTRRSAEADRRGSGHDPLLNERREEPCHLAGRRQEILRLGDQGVTVLFRHSSAAPPPSHRGCRGTHGSASPFRKPLGPPAWTAGMAGVPPPVRGWTPPKKVGRAWPAAGAGSRGRTRIRPTFAYPTLPPRPRSSCRTGGGQRT